MSFPERPVPKRITPCPIAESVIEVRFDTDFPADAVFGVIFERVKANYPKLIRLPILQLPAPILASDLELKYKPHYRLVSKDKTAVQIGPRTISLVASGEYPGWVAYSEKFRDLISLTEKAGVIKTITRLGLRFINFFEGQNVFEKITLNLRTNDTPFESDELYIRSVIKLNGFNNTLQISNGAKWKVGNGEKKGSIIDIDVVKIGTLGLKDVAEATLEQAHAVEKRIFFGLIKDDFLKNSLKPEY